MDKRFIDMDYRFSNYVMSFGRMIMVGCAKIVIIIEFANCMFMLISVVLMLFLVTVAKGIVRRIEWVIILVHLRAVVLDILFVMKRNFLCILLRY